MHGTQIGTLSLLVNEQVLWQKSKRQGVPAWYLANLTLPIGSDLRVGTFLRDTEKLDQVIPPSSFSPPIEQVWVDPRISLWMIFC